MAKRTVGMVTLSFPQPRRGFGSRRGSPVFNRSWEYLGEARPEAAESLTLARAALASILVIAAALALLFIWQGWRLTDLRSQFVVRQAAVERLEAQNQALELKVEQAFSLERIGLYARTVLGLVEPPLRYLRLSQPER
ncbi:MAG: hypothetical protein NUW06_01760 [Candidatus Acetothermia bacterium]|jgi:cell division protein FtsB|nr:hypothetical protein [Candidatus Acetothermia bacterium]MDH7504703.1 hypothetical protein [Candidatus Acetothermia bacterium]